VHFPPIQDPLYWPEKEDFILSYKGKLTKNGMNLQCSFDNQDKSETYVFEPFILEQYTKPWQPKWFKEK